jgi:hypothetical protein
VGLISKLRESWRRHDEKLAQQAFPDRESTEQLDAEPPGQPTWRQELRRLWHGLWHGWPEPPTAGDLSSGSTDAAIGCCAGMIAIIPAAVILTWSLLGSFMALVVWPAACLAGHAVRYATGTRHRYLRSLVEDLRLTL